MAQISEHGNDINHKVHYHDKMSKRILNLGSKKGDNNNNLSPQLSHIYNSLLVIIVDTL